MSYATVKAKTRELATTQSDAHEGPQKCQAIGCPCIASVQVEGGRWCCTSHAFSLPDLWPRITEGLRDHDWLLAFTRDVQKMDRRAEDWRGFASQFWAGQDDYCMPHAQENAIPYFNRMKGELDYRLGLCKRPAPRIPQQAMHGRKGNAADSFRRQA